jgi:hypothetical protein
VIERVDAAALMRDIEAEAGSRLRAQLVRSGAAGYQDAAVYEDVRAVLRRAVDGRPGGSLLLPELLGADEPWALDPDLHLSSHRPLTGRALVFTKKRILLPLARWLFEYAQENFRRQQRINQALMACLEELAIENARLRRELESLATRR